MPIILQNLNSEMKSLSGIGISGFDAKDKMTYRKALISACELHKPENPGRGEAILAYKIGVKLLDAGEEPGATCELTKEDHEFLIRAVDRSEIFLSLVIGRLHEYLTQAKVGKDN